MGYTKQDARVKHNEKYKVTVPTFPQINYQFSDHIFIDLGEAINGKYICG